MNIMREIKFRAKVLDSKVWFKWSLLDPIDMKDLGIDKKTLGQFTGLLDKNGVLIYEGDIIRRYTQFLEPKDKYKIGDSIRRSDGELMKTSKGNQWIVFEKLPENREEYKEKHKDKEFVRFWANSPEVVNWKDEFCGFEPFSGNYGDCCNGLGTDPKTTEVIGDIYSNPELLKKNAQ